MLNLQEKVHQGLCSSDLTLTERLPDFLLSPCSLQVEYEVEERSGYHLIHLHTAGSLHGLCQRCMQPFQLPYDNRTSIAVCRNEQQAESLLAEYESIVAANGLVDLHALITDELHLYAPRNHADQEACDSQVNAVLQAAITT